MSDTTNKIRKIIKSILAIPAACTAMPVKPKTPATMATIRKSRTQFNMAVSLRFGLMVTLYHARPVWLGYILYRYVYSINIAIRCCFHVVKKQVMAIHFLINQAGDTEEYT